MRIITGSARGTLLITPCGVDTRPTASKVKEALFSAVQFDIEGRRVLDLFAGSGQLGLEALSRGALHATFVDTTAASVEAIRANLEHAKLADRATVLQRDARAVLAVGGRYDLVFLDPPYRSGLLLPCLQVLAGNLNPGGIAVCETDLDASPLPEAADALHLQKIYRFGRTCLYKYVAAPTKKAAAP